MSNTHVDADMLIHRIAYASQTPTLTDGVDSYTLTQAKRHVKQELGLKKQPSVTALLNTYGFSEGTLLINKIAAGRCTEALIKVIHNIGTPKQIFWWVTDPGGTFRQELDSFEPYKGNREHSLIDVNYSQDTLEEHLGASVDYMDCLEADDAIACTARYGDFIVSGDKDFLQLPKINLVSIPITKGKDITISTTTTHTAAYNFCMQMLTGDNIDNIPGLPAVGKMKAKRLIENFKSLPLEDWYSYLSCTYASYLMDINDRKGSPHSEEEVIEFSKHFFKNNGDLLWLRRKPHEAFSEAAWKNAYCYT